MLKPFYKKANFEKNKAKILYRVGKANLPIGVLAIVAALVGLGPPFFNRIFIGYLSRHPT